MKKIAMVLIAVVLLSTIPNILQIKTVAEEMGYDWPTFQHDNRHTGYSNSPAPNTNATFWIHESNITYRFGSPVVSNNKVFVGSAESVLHLPEYYLYCLDENSGNLTWKYKTEYRIIGTPAVADGKVFFVSDDNYLYCLDENSGNLTWKYKTGDMVRSSPAVADGKVFVGSCDSYVYCIDENNGNLIWRYKTGGEVISSPAVADGKVFVGSCDNYVYCIKIDDESLVWKYETGSSVWSSPAVADGKVFVGSCDSYVYCIDENNGNLIWRYKTGPAIFNDTEIICWVVSSPAVADGKVFVGSYDAYLYCLNENTGELVWKHKTGYELGYRIDTSSAVANNKVFITSYYYLFCLDANTGDTIWKYDTRGPVSSPTVANGKVFVGSTKAVYVFGTSMPTELKMKILDGNKWHPAKVLFDDVAAANDYIDNFENNNKPPLDFGSLPLNIEIQNVGNEVAKNVICDYNITGIAVMIHLSGESIYKDKKVLHTFDYTTSKTIGTIDKGSIQSVKLDIPVKYMCIIAGELVLDKGDEWSEPFSMDILFTIVQLNIQLKVSGSNCQPVESQTNLFAVGNPNQLLDRMIDAIKERLEHHKEEALKDLLEMHIGVLASGVKSITYPFEVGQHRFDTTIEPETTSLNIGVLLPQGVKLVGLTVIIKEVISGITSTLSISSSAVSGFAMICFTDVYKLVPKGILSAQIELETELEVTAGVAQVEQQNSNVSLIMTNIIAPKFFEFYWNDKNYNVAIASNSTITSFDFDENATICFNATGDVNKNYFYKITIPSEIISGDFKVWCDNDRIYDFELTQNTTHSFLYFTYDFIKENYRITIVSEFSSLMFLLLLMFISMFIAILRKKHTKKFL